MIPELSPARSRHIGGIQKLLREADEDEWAFNLQGGDKIRLGWMPFQLADFIAVMSEVTREVNGHWFLEVGSGIGTKMMTAHELYGFSVHGIEYDETLATVCRQKNRGHVMIHDALNWPGLYSAYDVIWMYRVFRDPVLQDQLEKRLYAEMKRGAIFAGAALENAPQGWEIIVDDYDMGNRGAWKKP